MEPIDTETVQTPAGDYVIAWHSDNEGAEPPYNEGLGFAYDGGRDRIDVTEGEHANEVLAIIRDNVIGHHHNGCAIYKHSSAGIARYLRMAYGLIGIREVSDDYHTSEPSTDRDRIAGMAWAPSDALGPNGPGGYTDVAIGEYRAWAEGDVFGYTVTDPAGNEIDSCWGYYGYDEANRSYTRDQALVAVKNDAISRAEKSNLVGAGFVGII